EQLEPSAQLMASLSAQVSTPPPAAPPVGGALVSKIITVVILAVGLGAALWFVVGPKRPATEERSSIDGGVDAGRVGRVFVDPESEPCPPQGAYATPLYPAAILRPREEIVAEAMELLKRRPMTCAAQLAPIEDLRAHGRLNAEGRSMLDARRA